MRLVIEYFTALNQRDVAGIAKTLHFPFAIYENIEPLVYQNEAEFLRNPPPTLNATGSGPTQISPHSYDLLESVNVHLYCRSEEHTSELQSLMLISYAVFCLQQKT